MPMILSKRANQVWKIVKNRSKFLIRIAEPAAAEDRQKNLRFIEDLLNDVLDNVDRTILYEPEYQKAYKSHHQYALFELADIIPGFTLGNH